MTVSQVSADAGSPAAKPGRSSPGPLVGLSALAGLSAIAGASCCVVPLALAGIGAGSALFGGLAILAAYQPYVLGGAVAALAGAWLAQWRRSRPAACAADGACARRGTQHLTLVALWIVTLLVSAAVGWVYIEPVLLRAIQ